MQKQDQILAKLESIEKILSERKDEVLSFEQGCELTGFSSSYMYKLTSSGQIPHSKPNGKKIYFSKSELTAWLLKNRVSTQEEIEEQAVNQLVNGN